MKKRSTNSNWVSARLSLMTKDLERSGTSEWYYGDRRRKKALAKHLMITVKNISPCFCPKSLTKHSSLAVILGTSVFYPWFPCGTWMQQISGSQNIQWRRIYSRETNKGLELQIKQTAMSKYPTFPQEDTWTLQRAHAHHPILDVSP